jgi:hypothetical protein
MTTEVLQEVVQKVSNVKGLKILPLKSEVKPQVSPLGRDGKTGDGRDSVSPVKMMQDGSLSPRCPCPTNIGDEQKPTLIEKGQMGSKCSGFFLLPAIVSSSSVLSPLRFFPEPAVLAFDNSIPTPSGVAKGDWDDNEFQKTCELVRPLVSWSKDRCHSQKPKGLSAKGSPIVSSLVLKAWQDDPERLWDLDPPSLPFERPAAIEKQSLRRIPLVVPPPTSFCPSLATGSLVGAASPIASGFLKVSWWIS